MHVASCCFDLFSKLWWLVCLIGQCSMRHSKSIQTWPPRKTRRSGSFMAMGIHRSEPHWNPLECDQEEDGRWHHQTKLIFIFFIYDNAQNYIFIWNLKEIYSVVYRTKQSCSFYLNIHRLNAKPDHFAVVSYVFPVLYIIMFCIAAMTCSDFKLDYAFLKTSAIFNPSSQNNNSQGLDKSDLFTSQCITEIVELSLHDQQNTEALYER